MFNKLRLFILNVIYLLIYYFIMYKLYCQYNKHINTQDYYIK